MLASCASGQTLRFTNTADVGVMADGVAYASLAVRLVPGSPVPTYLYLKHHRSAAGEAHTDAALFVAGLPLCLTQLNLKELFGAFGDVEQVRASRPSLVCHQANFAYVDANNSLHHGKLQVQVHPKRTSAIVVFTGKSALSAALKAARRGTVVDYAVPDEPAGESTGLRARVEAHKAQYPGNAALQKSLDKWMESFEQEEERKRKAAEEAAAGDGWTVVTKRAGRKRKSGTLFDMYQSLALTPTCWRYFHVSVRGL